MQLQAQNSQQGLKHKKRTRSRIAIAIATMALASVVSTVQAKSDKVTWNDIVSDQETTTDVLGYGMGVKAQRYSDLTQINTDTIKAMVPQWTMSFGDEKQRGQETQALYHDGVLYVTASYSRIFAMDARTGEKLWTYSHRLPEDIRPCCDVVNRGAAIYGDKVYFGTLDARVVALDKKTGKRVWSKKFGDHKAGYTMTGAPTIIKDKKTGRVMLIHGSSGDEFGVVGKLFARDPETGEEIWMRPFVEGHMGRINGKESTPTGDSVGAQHGENHFKQGPAGASTYTPLTIDAKRGMVYASTAEEYGFTGEAGPYSVIAYDLKTGRRAWQQSLLPTPAERRRICGSRETDCRNMFSAGTSVLIHPVSRDKDILVVGLKSGVVHALDPDEGGLVLWSNQVAEGGDLGGIMYGLASDADKIYVPVADVDSPEGRFTGSLVAIDAASGIVVWRAAAPKPACNWDSKYCVGGQVAAVTVVSNMVFAGFWDGYLRIYAADDGRLLREIDTAIEYDAVNGTASGGQVSGYPVSVGKDALYVTSGASSIMKSGNALLVYTVDGK